MDKLQELQEQGKQLLSLFKTGNSYIGEGFQPHIFLVLIPLILIFLTTLVYKKKIQALSLDHKVTLNYLASVVLTGFITYHFIFIDKAFNDIATFNFDVILKSLMNYDMMLMIVVNLSIIFKWYGVVRSLTPISIVYGLATVISNPGQTIYASHVVFDIMLAIIPTFVTVMTMKNITVKSFVASEVFNMLAFTFIAMINVRTGHSYSDLTAEILSHNEFYNTLFVTGDQRIAFWIFSIFTFELIAWVILRFALDNRRTVYSLKTFWWSITAEIRSEVLALISQSSDFFDENEFVALDRNELVNVDQYFVETTQMDKIEEKLFTEVNSPDETEFVNNYTSILLKTPNGPRSPSVA